MLRGARPPGRPAPCCMSSRGPARSPEPGRCRTTPRPVEGEGLAMREAGETREDQAPIRAFSPPGRRDAP